MNYSRRNVTDDDDERVVHNLLYSDISHGSSQYHLYENTSVTDQVSPSRETIHPPEASLNNEEFQYGNGIEDDISDNSYSAIDHSTAYSTTIRPCIPKPYQEQLPSKGGYSKLYHE